MKSRTSSTFSSKVIREWLHEYKSLPEPEMNTYANTIRANDELIIALYELLQEDDLPQEVTDPVCHQLFDFYRSGRQELMRFTLELVPLLVMTYLTGVANNDKKKCGGIEACLLGIYNLDVTDKDGNAKMSRFTIPTIACPSIYHEPPSLATLALTESALLCYHSDEHVVINVGPLPQVENINGQNRLTVLTHVMSCYHRDVANLSPRSHQTLCRMCSRLTKMGFEMDGSQNGADAESADLNESLASSSSSMHSSTQRRGVKFSQERRVTLSSQLLVELLSSLYFVMFNGHARLGTQAVEDIDERARYEMWADVLLVTNAIKNSLMYNPSGQPLDGPMGISIALSPTTSNPSFSKHAITNASFRAKKLPEDIPVVQDVNEPLDLAAARVSRVDGDVLTKLPDDKAPRHKRDKPDKKGDKDKKTKKGEKDRRGSGERASLLALHDKSEDDIDVPDSPETEGLPPTYEDIVEQDKMATKVDEKSKPGHMFAKPLKSIMKSSKDKMKISRKESDAKRKDVSMGAASSMTGGGGGGAGPSSSSSSSVAAAGSAAAGSGEHSPRPSQPSPLPTSQSLNLTQSLSNGAVVDLDSIQVSVVQNATAGAGRSRVVVDQIELRSTAGLPPGGSGGGLQREGSRHRRTSSFPEGGFASSSSSSSASGQAAAAAAAANPAPASQFLGRSPGGSCEAEPLLRGVGGSQSAINGANGSEDEEDEEEGTYSTPL